VIEHTRAFGARPALLAPSALAAGAARLRQALRAPAAGAARLPQTLRACGGAARRLFFPKNLRSPLYTPLKKHAKSIFGVRARNK
jgi:hypothetical protein